VNGDSHLGHACSHSNAPTYPESQGIAPMPKKTPVSERPMERNAPYSGIVTRRPILLER
jgi:hypothetical protein